MVWLLAIVLATVELLAAYTIANMQAERIFVVCRYGPSPLLFVRFLVCQGTAL